MLKLPIAERDLRIGARSTGTYRSRRNIAAVLFLVFAGIYWNLNALGGWASPTIFAVLSRLCFAYALFAGLILAADAISSEKRDGTLGLLFLTALKPYDLIAGTISATSLKAIYGLLATFPILGLSLLLGGIEYAEFARVCVALVTTLIFSLCLCMFVSCLSRRRLPAITRCAVLLFLFAGAIPIFTSAVEHATRLAPPTWVRILGLFSPTTALELSTRAWFAVRADYWLSLILINSTSAAMLLASCFLLPRVWKDGSAPRWFGRSEKKRATTRRRLDRQNPFFWLAYRQSSESTRFLTFLIFIAVVASIVGRYTLSTGAFGAFYTQINVWAVVVVIAHCALLFKFAALSTSRLAEDRELGALESILVTPLRVRHILRGQCQALFAQLAGPCGAVLLLHGILFWAFLLQYSMEEAIPGGVRGVLRSALEEMGHGGFEPWSLFGVSAMMIGAALIAIFAWIALASSGMWIALRVRHASRTLWLTLTAVFVPPTAAFFAVITFGVWLDIHRGNGTFWGWFCLFFSVAFSVANSIGLSIYSWLKLRKDFRHAATERFSKPLEPSFALTFRWPIRIALVSNVILLLISLLYAEEKWRGLRAWRAVQAKYHFDTSKLRSIATPPPAAPDAENFGAAKLFKPLFDYRYERSNEVIWPHPSAQEEVMTITVTGTRQSSFYKTNFNADGNWALQKATDLAALQKYYKSNSVFSSLCLTNFGPAETVLKALSLFDAELNELEEASRRPKVRFPIHYDETHAAYWMHLPFLKNIAGILQLRATARLAAGDIPDARSDIEFCIRLANTLRGEPGFFPYRIRSLILLHALNPLWEGLGRNQWDDESLRILQRDCTIDLLADYPRVVREQALNFIDFFDRITLPDETLLIRTGKEPIGPRAARFYPVGWKYLNQAGLVRLTEETLIPLVDPPAHRVFHPTNLVQAIRKTYVTIDPVSQRIIPWDLQMYQEILPNTAHAQVSLDQAILACALERWRRAHGSFPANLDSLAPDYIEKIPHDPITGNDYKYKVGANGKFVLYSPGWDETDDGGVAVVAAQVENGQDLRKGDWVWKY